MQKYPKLGFRILNKHKKRICIGTKITSVFFLPILSANKYEIHAPIIIPKYIINPKTIAFCFKKDDYDYVNQNSINNRLSKTVLHYMQLHEIRKY